MKIGQKWSILKKMVKNLIEEAVPFSKNLSVRKLRIFRELYNSRGFFKVDP